LAEIFLHFNELHRLPTGMFDGLVDLRRVMLGTNPGAPFTLNIDIERRANGQARARILEATPSRVEVTWTIPGRPEASGTATILKGQRTSAWFGMTSRAPANIQLSNPRFPDVCLDIAGSPCPDVIATFPPRFPEDATGEYIDRTYLSGKQVPSIRLAITCPLYPSDAADE